MEKLTNEKFAELSSALKKSVSKAKETGDELRILNLFERFYTKMEEFENDKFRRDCQWKINYAICKWLNSTTIRMKDCSKHWNPKLVAECFEASKIYNKFKNEWPKEKGLKFLEPIFIKVQNCEDKPTMFYCMQIIHNNGIVDFGKSE